MQKKRITVIGSRERLKRAAAHIGERTLSNLLKLEGYVYVRLGTDEIAKRFLKDAQAEGFTFSDGVKPTKRHISDIFALHKDKTLCYLGWAGHMAYAQAERMGDEPIIRVDYQKYVDGQADYIIDRHNERSAEA
ncbi:MAG: hypothetical protein IJO03_09050 [Clostridia bacterium]|nr:hypothetical protein [Clostridia bacterium]